MKSLMTNLMITLLLMLAVQTQAATVWVEREGYHTALVLPAAEATRHAPQLQGISGSTGYVRFGWGNRDYYGASQKTPGMALKALLLPSQSAVEVALFNTPELAGDTLVKLEVANDELHDLVAFIASSFALNTKGQLVLARTEPTGFRYYQAHGHYYLFRNCNNWTAQALQRGGQDVRYRSAFLAGRVMRQLP